MAKRNKPPRQSIRIIGGQWRGRRLAFPDIDGLRPTADRIRETLFNWLQPYLPGSVCIDLFSGSGALGFEAASRGADSVDMVELNAEAYKQLQANKSILAAEQCRLSRQSAQQFLMQASISYDIVFLDPPFQANLWFEIADLLMQNSLLHTGSLIYMECGKNQDMTALPAAWHLLKDKHAGEVRYCLFVIQ